MIAAETTELHEKRKLYLDQTWPFAQTPPTAQQQSPAEKQPTAGTFPYERECGVDDLAGLAGLS